MFNLFRSRAKLVRYFMGALLLLVALSMVTYLIPGFGSMGGREQDQVVAEIGKEVVTAQDVRQSMQRLLQNGSIPKDMAGLYVPQLIDSMITERALVYEAQRLGFQASEDDVVRSIAATLPQLFQNGQFAGRDVYAQFLARQNLTIPEFESDARRELLSGKLQNLIADSVVVTPDEVAKEYQQRNEKIKLEYIAISPAQVRPEIRVTPEEVRSYFQAHHSSFNVPEKRDLAMIVVDEASTERRITLPDAELRKVYEANKDHYRTPERVHVRHILLKTTGKPPDEIPKIQAKAEDLLKQLKAGADFATLARKYSDDSASAPKGGDLGWIVRGQTVPNFENAAFSLKPKEISGVIKTEYGFHILQVLEHQDARLKPFDEVKDQLAQEWKRQVVFDTMQRLADQAHDELVRNPEQAEQIAHDLNVPLVKVDKVGAGEPVPDFGVNLDFQDAINSLQKGGVTPVMQAPGNKLVVTVVTHVLPARPAELSEVENQIRDTLTANKVNQLVNQRAAQVSQKAKLANGDLTKVARQMGLEVKTTQEFTRSGAADGIGSAGLLLAGFHQPVGSIFGPIPVNGQWFVCKIVSQIPPDMSKLPEEAAAIRADLKSKSARERTDLFEDSVKTALIREKKIKIHESVVDRIVASYRG